MNITTKLFPTTLPKSFKLSKSILYLNLSGFTCVNVSHLIYLTMIWLYPLVKIQFVVEELIPHIGVTTSSNLH